jgi:LacI family transcriptional regulator
MSVSIDDIAKRAGVSSLTVARILLGDVRESHPQWAANAKSIRRIAADGRRPNGSTRAVACGRTHAIGLLYTDDAWISAGVNANVVNSLMRSLQSRGYHLVFCPIDESGSWEEVVLRGQIDGGVVLQALPADVANAIQRRKLPLVLLGDDNDPRLSQVLVDDFAGAYTATEHLLGLGHTRVMMFVHESSRPHSSVRTRLSGYRSAMQAAGLEPQECLHASEEEAVKLLVRGDSRPTAVVCYSDLESSLLVHTLWQYGRSIPGDVSLVGFNDVFATRYMTPPLTTIGIDAARIGKLGADLVLNEIEASSKQRKPTTLTVKPTLIVRGSTAAPSSLNASNRTARWTAPPFQRKA